jgi:hypothetical protein
MSTLLERLRQPKIANMSIFDWVTSLLAAYAVGAYILRIRTVTSWAFFLLGWIAFGIATHWAVGVPTMLGYYLGINEKPKRSESP